MVCKLCFTSCAGTKNKSQTTPGQSSLKEQNYKNVCLLVSRVLVPFYNNITVHVIAHWNLFHGCKCKKKPSNSTQLWRPLFHKHHKIFISYHKILLDLDICVIISSHLFLGTGESGKLSTIRSTGICWSRIWWRDIKYIRHFSLPMTTWRWDCKGLIEGSIWGKK